MISIGSKIIKNQPNFWNHCVFHPTDAIEDPWGRRILDETAKDRAIDTVRVYTMLEDIVSIDKDARLSYDFSESDLRLDYLAEKGYGLTLAYAGIPDCIAASTENKTSISKNKTRYKGKMWNSAPPSDYALWEEVCYEYTKHIVERYGLSTVKRWDLHCFNEPDVRGFFLSELPSEATDVRLAEYCKLYAAFVRGVGRVSQELRVGGPALAYYTSFLGGFLDYVRENGLKMDFITAHYYGTSPTALNEKGDHFNVEALVKRHRTYVDVIAKHGFSHLPLNIDEWGMATHGFYNREECPALMARETEVFSAYFAKLIARYIEEDFKIEKLMICLSGQHEMTEDFSGFRNFFTLNFIKKPIYNAFVLAGKLGDRLLSAQKDDANLYVVPTRRENGAYAVLLSYSSEFFEETIPAKTETLRFEEDLTGKKITVFCIDKETTNPYRLFQQMGEPKNLTDGQLQALRAEGTLKARTVNPTAENAVTLDFTPNSTYLINVE